MNTLSYGCDWGGRLPLILDITAYAVGYELAYRNYGLICGGLGELWHLPGQRQGSPKEFCQEPIPSSSIPG
ncbi:hypothetical protein GS597_03735 [Synechococcales cyanobacterium C]|uniref:Uncharacterized protein n=1 Tax=Petrachloros mirabilis ULC683 TaxID=2781853 RepID=A0A8K1ZXD7_9CYAN|nr:hypothetical protein [Petrachloros mirabilis]NCJ05633.1 hypothetical protein [Petrachloros mirabilis ULC683]